MSSTIEHFDNLFSDSREFIGSSIREQGLKAFKELGVPSKKLEDWKYTDLSKLSKQSGKLFLSKSRYDSKQAKDLIQGRICEVDSYQIIFVDGKLIDEDFKFELAGVQINKNACYGEVADFSSSALLALNTAFASDPIEIKIASDVKLDKPIHFVFLTSSKEVSSFNRIVVRSGASSEVEVIESHISSVDGDYFSNIAIEFVLEKNSVVRHYKIQNEAKNAIHYSSVSINQESDSNFYTFSCALGGGLVRNEVRPTLNGSGIETHMYGLSVLDGTQHVDNNTILDHAKPHCHSNEIYAGVYSGKSAGVFNGTIIVREDAQKTDAIQSNKALLLSKEASIRSQPQLKIWADDVKCTHGATVGELDKEALFYMKSRGISDLEAKNILIKAFAHDILGNIENSKIRDYIESQVTAKLDSIS